MALPLVGAAFMLELGRRRQAPLSAERVVAALLGGCVGWAINAAFHLNLIRLVVPQRAARRASRRRWSPRCSSARFRASSARWPEWRSTGRRSGRRSPAVRLALGGGRDGGDRDRARAHRGPVGGDRAGRRRDPVGRERRRASVDAAGCLHPARRRDHGGGRGGRLRRRVRPVPRRRRHRRPCVRAGARCGQRSRRRGGRGRGHRRRLPAAIHRGGDGVRGRRAAAVRR